MAAGDENADSVDEGSVGDDTILADEAVLTVNEIEDVLRDAFAEADQLVSITIVQGGNASVGGDFTSGSPGPSLDCVGNRHHPIYRGVSHPHTAKVELESRNLRSLLRRGAASQWTSDQGNDSLRPKPPGLSDAL